MKKLFQDEVSKRSWLTRSFTVSAAVISLFFLSRKMVPSFSSEPLSNMIAVSCMIVGLVLVLCYKSPESDKKK